MPTFEQPLFTEDDIPVLERLAIVIDPEDKADKGRLKSYVQELARLPVLLSFTELDVYRDFEKTLQDHCDRQSQYLPPKSHHPFSGVFIDTKSENDRRPLLREIGRAVDRNASFISVASAIGKSTMRSIVEEFGKEIDIAIDLFPSDVNERDFYEAHCGVNMYDIAMRRVEIAQDAGCKTVICAADTGPVIRDSPDVDNDLKIVATGTRLFLPKSESTHRYPATPHQSSLFADFIFAGHEIWQSRTLNGTVSPIQVIKAWVDNIKQPAA